MQPLELVNAAIVHLKLELAWLPSGDPALKGAHAVFDDQSGTIFAEDVGSPSERALVVAHEIGHVLLGLGAHSTVGLMAASLDLPRIALGGLWFDRVQAALIRARLGCDHAFVSHAEAICE